MPEQNVTDQNFDQEVLQSNKPVLVDFWAVWCGPCQIFGPIIEEVTKEIGGKAKVLKLNVDENQETAKKYNVSGIPAILFFKGGKEVERMTGVQGKDVLMEKLEKLSA